MKKQSNVLKLYAFILLMLGSVGCDGTHECWYKYYQLKNKTGKTLSLELYSTYYIESLGNKPQIDCDTIIINNEKNSDIFREYFCAPDGESYYIDTTDSIFVVVDNKKIKKYTRVFQSNSERTPYNKNSYVKMENNSEKPIYIYTFLPEDFE